MQQTGYLMNNEVTFHLEDEMRNRPISAISMLERTHRFYELMGYGYEYGEAIRRLDLEEVIRERIH